MDTERWQLVRELFQGALELPPQERVAFVESRTAGPDNDAEEVRRLVLELLDAESVTSSSDEAGGATATTAESTPGGGAAGVEGWEAAIRGLAREVVAEHQLASAYQQQPERPGQPRVPQAGDQVGPYIIDRLLGSGGMGQVLLAHDTRLERPVAMKFLVESAGKLDSSARPSFEREVKAASALNHPNILTVFDVGTHEGTPWLATEFIDGPTLRQRIQAGPMPASEAVDIVVQLLSALEAAHGAGIIHRDIKPENVMLRPDGIVKLVDFSLAKSIDLKAFAESAAAAAISTTATTPDDTVFAGTVRYMSPQQANQQRLDERTDLWSLGAVFYELLAGEPLFRGTDPVAMLEQLQQLHTPPPALKARNHQIPPGLLAIVQRALQPDPGKRYQSAGEMLQELRAAQRRMRSRRPWVWWSIGAAAIVTMLAGGWLWYQSRSRGLLSPSQFTFDRGGYTAEPAISADGKWVAFVSDRGRKGNLSLWVQPVENGGSAVLLFDDGMDVHEPDFSPDGREIVFRSSSKDAAIRVMARTPGAAPRTLSAYGVMPRFSPDGQWVVFMTAPETEHGSQIWVVPSAGNGAAPRQLAEDFEDAHFPIWAEDGRSILICGTRVSGDPTAEHDWWVIPFSGSSGTAGGKPVKTGASGDPMMDQMRGVAHQLGPPAVWKGGRIYLSTLTASGRSLGLRRVALDAAQGGLRAERDVLTDHPAVSDVQARVGGGRIVFARGSLGVKIYELPVDADTGKATGPLRMLHSAPADVTFPHLSREGVLAVMQSGPGNRKIVVSRPGEPGTPVVRSSNPQDYPRWSPDGQRLAFRNMQNPKVPILVATPATGEVVTACRDCGGPSDWSPDGRYILFEPGATVAHIGRLEVESGAKEDFIVPRGNSLRGARYSPDGKWVAFHEELKRGMRQVHIAAVDKRGAESWIAVTDGANADSSPAWSPDGNLLYFLSNRQGLRSPWAQRLDPVTKQPVGEPFPVLQLTESRRTILQTASHREPFIGFEVYAGRIVLAMDEIASNLWIDDLPR